MTEEKERALIFARTGGAVLLHQTPQADLLRAVGEARLESDESGLAVLIAELRRRAGPRVKKEKPVESKKEIPIRFAYFAFQPAGRRWRATVAYRLEGRKIFYRVAWCEAHEFVKSRGREEATKKLRDGGSCLVLLPRDASIYESLFEVVSTDIVIAAYSARTTEFGLSYGRCPTRLPEALIRDQRKSKAGPLGQVLD